MTQNKKGFTLIELVVVMAIIAVLAALMVAAISGARKQSVATQNQGNARTIETALESYAAGHNGQYPTITAGTTFAAITTAQLPTLSAQITGSCANAGGVVTSISTSTFTLTYYDSSCATSANDKTITH